ncbi:hypothetical protein GCM10010254_40930 [Streptomyces chromofuscus]|nr:hypothetical protein GCM10010254_40930 [Streptomyces chromofuscus]
MRATRPGARLSSVWPTLLLQPPYLPAQWRLRAAEAGGGVSDVQFLGGHDEGVHLRKGGFGALHTARDVRPVRT